MDLLLEARQDVLAKHGGNDVLDFCAEEGLPGRHFVLFLKELPDHHHFPKDRCRLSKRKRGVEVKQGLLAGQVKMDGVTHLMGQGEGIPEVAGKIQKKVRMQGWGQARAESSPVFSLAHPGVDPAPLEGFVGNFPEEGMKLLERFKEQGFGFFETNLLL